MTRKTLASQQAIIDEQADSLRDMEVEIKSRDAQKESLRGDISTWRKATTEARLEIRRLEMLASEMRGFIMAHHSKETLDGGTTYYREQYGSDEESNKITIPVVKFPFMDAPISLGV